MVRPAPSILVVKHVMTQPRQTDHIWQIIPRDTANRILSYHAGHNDPEPRVHHIPKCPRSSITQLANFGAFTGGDRPKGKLDYNPASVNSRASTRSPAKYSR